MKTCSKCKAEKSLEDFEVRSDSKDGRRGVCKVCLNEHRRAKRKEDPEKYRAYINEYARNKRKNDPEFLQRGRDAYKAWRESHIEYDKERQRRYRSENLDRYAMHAANRRAMKKKAEGSFSLQEWTELCDRYSGLCLSCEEVKPLTVDHVIPLSKGGTNYISNIQPLCGPCNSSKKDKEIDYRPNILRESDTVGS